MSDGEDSDSAFYYPEEEETAEKREWSRRGRHFDNVEASKDTGYKKLVPVVLIPVIKSAI